MDTVTHAFAVEKCKRQIKTMDDVDALRTVALALFESAEGLRKMLQEQVLENMDLRSQLEAIGDFFTDDQPVG